MKLLQSKQGMMNPMPKSINLILALITAAIGVLGMFGTQIGFNLPLIPAIIVYGLIAFAGIILLLDGMMGVGNMSVQLVPRNINFLIGVLVVLSGAALILGELKIFVIPSVPTTVIHVILMVSGAIMLLDGLLGAKDTSM